MSSPGAEFVDLFLQEASEHLQHLREYAAILQDPYPAAEEVERLYVAAHTLKGSSAMYGFTLFAELAAKLAHVFQYAMNVGVAPDAAAPLVEFISETVAVLESDLLLINDTGKENTEEITAFKQRFPFAFQAQAAEEPPVPVETAAAEGAGEQPSVEEPGAVVAPATQPQEIEIEIPPETEVPAEILEFFVPEAEEHLQTITECLLALETNPNEEDIHRLFRAMHTVKGSAAQVGLPRIALVAHRAEDLIGRLRDGELKPSAAIVDLCLDAVDALKKFLYSQWPDEATMQQTVRTLLKRIARLAPEDEETPKAPTVSSVSTVAPLVEASSPAETEKAAAASVLAAIPAPDEIPSSEVSSETAPALALSEPAVSASAGNDVATDAAAAPHVEVAAAPLPAPETQAPTEKPVGKTTATPQSKSVRIALERLDRMMNAVGELVINRTRMLGRLAELEKLADVLNFSKARMSDKIVEFQDKYEFSRLHVLPPVTEWKPESQNPNFGRRATDHLPFPTTWSEPVAAFPFRGGYSSYSHSFDASLAEFSELEMDRYDDFSILSRSLTEISADITEILTQLDTFVRRVDSDIDEFTKLAHRLQDEITQARMVPIGNLYTRISRTVRDAAKAVGKRVELELSGAETELDNNIIQQIADPLLHLVRNAVAHGIEREEERYHAGKPDDGKVAVRAYHRGNHIYVEVEDDGRGIDWDHVRNTAVELEIIAPDEVNRLTERQLQDLLFHPGFSTAPRKSELAGRGVGLDVVRTNLNALNGEIEIETQKGLGTRFTLKVPLTLIISQALFVRCGQQVFAFPLAFVEEIRRIRDGEIEEVGGKLLTKVRDVVTEVVRLEQQLGLEPFEPVNGFYRLVIVNVAGRQVGIIVEEVLRKDEIVIKNLGEYLRNVKLFPGATIAPDGSLILLVDVNRLIAGEAIERRPLMTSANAAAARIFAPGALAVAAGEIPEEAVDQVPEERVVVLADDSISVRKFVGRMLEKAGYRVRLAADGLEALEIVAQTRCDLVVTDLEMPRTNGYELMAHLRQAPETRDIPVMVVTSRAGAKHRDKAIKQGASDFLVKPVQEDQFIAAVNALIGAGNGVARAKASGA
ncbi:MAG: Hpt domain-containing protein [Terriglobales bacterium]